MSKEETKEESKKEKKRGPIFNFFRFIIVLFFILLFAIIALLIYLGINIVSSDNFTGNETIEKIKNENKSFETVRNDILYDSFNTLSDTNTTYSILLDEEEMNYLLHSFSKELGNSVDNIYMYYDSDNKYTLYMPIEWLFFKSCAVMDLNITYTSSTDTIDLNITNLTLGKFGISNFFVKTFILPNMNTEYIDKLFEKVDLKTKTNFDGGNINISINSDDFINLILSQTNSTLYGVLYSTLKTNNDVSYSFTSEEIGINFDLSDAKETANTHSIETNLSQVKTKMNTLIENKIINEKNSNLIFNYLVNGYSYLTKEEQVELKKIDLSSISITSNNVETYSGVIERTSGLLSTKFIIKNLKELSPSVVISEADLNNELSNQDLVGTSKVFFNMDLNSYTYIIIESLYTEIAQDFISVNILLNINSFETLVKLNFSKISGVEKLELKLESAYLTDIAIDNSNSDIIMNFIEGELNNKLMYVNEYNNFVLDLSVYESDMFKGAMEYAGLYSEYELLDEEIKISYKKK